MGVIGDWTSTVMGTTAPFSAIRGRSILITLEPSLIGRPPKRRFSVASTFSSGWSAARFHCADAVPGPPARKGAATADTPRSPSACNTTRRETIPPSTHSCMISLLWLACLIHEGAPEAWGPLGSWRGGQPHGARSRGREVSHLRPSRIQASGPSAVRSAPRGAPFAASPARPRASRFRELSGLACRCPPLDLVVGLTLLAGQEIPRPEVDQQMSEPQLAARPLHLRHRRAHVRLVGDAVRVQALEPTLGLEQPRPLRARVAQHGVHERRDLRFLVGGQAELGLQLEDVPRPGIAISIGGERHSEGVTLSHDRFELLGAGERRRLLPLSRALRAVPAVLLGPRRLRASETGGSAEAAQRPEQGALRESLIFSPLHRSSLIPFLDPGPPARG